MATPLPISPNADQPHFVSLVLQSKKALQHGELLCSRASTLSSTSVQSSVDVLALDAKVRWITDAVLEQLKLAAHVAKSIEQKRSQLGKQAEDWDRIRNKRLDALDAILESLGAQAVPPEFHSMPTDSSVFGSNPNSDSEDDINTTPFRNGSSGPSQSPTDTVRGVRRPANGRVNGSGSQADRSSWKTLRDFVDERAIEDVLDRIENDRNSLDDILARTLDYPESLSNTISAIREGVPVESPLPSTEDIFSTQEEASTKMANHLESLAAHYDQMLVAMRDHEAGEDFSEEDIQEMNRDTDELPAIIAELEESYRTIEATHEQLLTAKAAIQQHLDTHRKILDDLDALGEVIAEMLEHQQAVETESAEHLALLHHHLITIEDLHHRFTSYQYSYSKLLFELTRRRHYHEAADHIIKGMLSQLDSMIEEERLAREDFNAEHGQYLPEDVCLCIQNPPTRWTVGPWGGEVVEVLPVIAPDLLEEAKQRIASAGGTLAASQSL